MSRIEARIAELGLTLPEPMRAPAPMSFRFRRVRVHRGLGHVSGHGPVDGERTLAAGRVDRDLGVDEAAEAARLCGLSILASLRDELGDLDRVTGWVRAFGMVNASDGFNAMPPVVNGFSQLVLDIWGETGEHARSAIGVASLPFDWPVEIEALVEVDGG